MLFDVRSFAASKNRKVAKYTELKRKFGMQHVSDPANRIVSRLKYRNQSKSTIVVTSR